MKNPAGKLIAAAASLGLAILLLAGASLAWFTLSTAPEMGGIQVGIYTNHTLVLSADGVDYSRTIDLSPSFTNMAPLRPVSTSDGFNWFIPAYDEHGNLKDPSEFYCDSDLSYANITLLDGNGIPLSGGEKLRAEGGGYYIYTDFWMKTEEDACNVRLSMPSIMEQLEEWEKTAGIYGTYVLGNYKVYDTETEDGTTQTVAVMDQAAETCARIGFLVYDDEENPDFYIYEPNCDGRSSANKPRESEDFHDVNESLKYRNEEDYTYVLGYSFDPESYVDGNYFLTRPIVKDTDGGRLATDAELNAMLEKTMLQQKSRWYPDDALQEFFTEHGTLDSNMVGNIGRFLSYREILESEEGDDASSEETPAVRVVGTSGLTESNVSPVLCYLTKDNPVRVRLFIWLEGQDVDCWNDIATGSFIVNLEMAGEFVDLPETGPEDPGEGPSEDPADDPAEDPAEDPADDPAEDPAEDPADDPAEDPAEDPDENSGGTTPGRVPNPPVTPPTPEPAPWEGF